MGTVLELITVSDETIDRLLADPPLVWRLYAPDDPSMYEAARLESDRPGLLGRLLGGGGPRKDDSPAPELPLGPAEGQRIDLDRAWHGIHYLLTGTSDGGEPPLDFLVRGGEEIGDVEVADGPVRAIRAGEVRKVSDALAEIEPEALRERFDPEDMIEKDVEGALDDYLDDDAKYFIGHFETLKDFVGAAAEKELGLVLVLG